MQIPPPALSVVVVTRDEYRTLRPIVAALSRQTVAGTIELVIVAPDAAALRVPESEVAGFHSTALVTAGPVSNRGRAAAHGVAAASAPIVALSENHCFPEPDWAERILACHDGPWAGVGPAVGNANPDRVLSRVIYAFGYGRFPVGGSAAAMPELPLHNSSYRKAALPETVEELAVLLGNERRLQEWLQQRGEQLYFTPEAVKWHLNEQTWKLVAGMWFFGGRGYGTTRARDWPVWRRVVYVVLWPLLMVPIASNVWARMGALGQRRQGAAVAVVVAICAMCHAFGEALAYVGLHRTEFTFVEDEEFLIRERLGPRPGPVRPDVAGYLALLDPPGKGR